MDAKQEIVNRLRERQGARTQAEYAEWLGISRPMLSRLYSDDPEQKRRIGVDSLTRICEKYPDLAYLFLSEATEELE